MLHISLTTLHISLKNASHFALNTSHFIQRPRITRKVDTTVSYKQQQKLRVNDLGKHQTVQLNITTTILKNTDRQSNGCKYCCYIMTIMIMMTCMNVIILTMTQTMKIIINIAVITIINIIILYYYYNYSINQSIYIAPQYN